MDWDTFERKASRVTPGQPLKARRCWIGVLRHDKDPRQPLGELDFTWMIGHSKITLDKIYNTYENVHGLAGCLFLISRNGIAQREMALKDVLEGGSRLIVFRAVSAAVGAAETSSCAEAPASLRTPLEEVSLNGTGSPVTPHTTHHKPKNEDEYVLRVPRSGSSHARTPLQSLQTPCKADLQTSYRASPQTAPIGTCDQPQHSSDRHLQYGQLVLPRAPFTPVAPINPARPSTPSSVERQPSNRTVENAAASAVVNAEPTSRSPCGTSNHMPSFESTRAEVIQHPNARQLDGVCASAIKMDQIESHELSFFHNKVEEEPSQPFNAGNFFSHKYSSELSNNSEEKPMYDRIRDIVTQENLEILERSVELSLQVLQAFKRSFTAHAASIADAQAWAESIDKLMSQAKRKRTVVGVVGNTGAGKSSVINALLDEERLVPTNCMRACTAVVTEMSWNDSTNASSRYRAEIEFVARADWEEEVATLMKEFLNDNGTLQREALDQSTDAGIAWAKFHAVHSKITRDELGDCTVARLMSDRALNVLGTTKKIDSPSAQRFYQELQKYVDSKEKVAKKDKGGKSDKSTFDLEYWPLIKVVRIYTKAPALSTGAVIVDLPGVHDSNAARAAVAQGYIQQCTGLWIVAPITRAVDDKAAKTLLGDSFKRQLKLDGGFSNITFICSKTDDISITEAIDTLELEDQVQALDEQQTELEQEIKATQNKVEDLKESQQVYQQAAREAGDAIELWEELKDQYDDGKQVYAPAPRIAKRKKNESTEKSRKRHQKDDEGCGIDVIVIDDDDDGGDGCSDAFSTDNEDEVQAPLQPLTGEDINAKLRGLKETRKNARREGLEIKPRIEELRPHIQEAQTKIKAIRAEISRICISGRNEYSKQAIQNDYAAGIKELDQEDAAEEDEDNFNPDEEQRDYDQVARSLPVFCVSSRAYQKMCGRLQKDDAVPGFNTFEETGVPQLQAHCKMLTEAGRVQTCRSFLLSVCQLLTAVTLWASSDCAGLHMTDDDKQKQVSHINRRLDELQQGLEACVKACLHTMKSELNDQIFDKYPDLIQEAIVGAPYTAASWGAHRSEGGLVWATYKAVVRRHGVYSSSSAGHRDFNSDLVEPIIKKLASGWERAFQIRIPKAFATFIAESAKLLRKFHDAVEKRARENQIGLASLSTLETQLVTYESIFGEQNQGLVERMTALQREANRDFAPTILKAMQNAYVVCTNERGPGSFKRMKAAMSEHVERSRHHMFSDATMTVKRHLQAMCGSLQETMERVADEIWTKLKADYMRALAGIEVNQGAVLSQEERTMRAQIMDQLRAVDWQFEPILRGEFSPRDGDVCSVAGGSMADDEEGTAFEPAPDSGHDDTSVTEALPADEQASLATPQSNETSEAEL
ncbi:tat pathway signal sequence [Stagonosporopsis vannaccii]|nr:tat pathway signal sequence [Stagonosporopsis vannaccii]